MSKIIVTGATSFIGIHLVRQLITNNKNEVYAIVRRNSEKRKLLPISEQIHIIELNMNEYCKLSNVIQSSCDVCFTLAWNGTRGESRNIRTWQQENYMYSMECIKEVCKMGCKKIICAGSQAEYGFMEGIITEKSINKPNTEYGKAKLKFYQDALKYCHENEVSIKEPRFFSLYGEDDNPKTMILSILNAMLMGEPCKLTECIQYWDFLYIEDAVQAMIMLMDQICEDGIYNFASGDNRKLKDFIEEMYQMTQSNSELQYGKISYPLTGMVSMKPSIGKLTSQTGWKPQVSFHEGINKVIKKLQREEEKEIEM